MKGKIFKIKNAEDELVLPITTTEAVYSEDGKTLNDELDNINSSLDTKANKREVDNNINELDVKITENKSLTDSEIARLKEIANTWEAFKNTGGEINGSVTASGDWTSIGAKDSSDSNYWYQYVRPSSDSYVFARPGTEHYIMTPTRFSPVWNSGSKFLGEEDSPWQDIYLKGSSSDTNGYTKLPNGLIMQWGSFGSIESTTDVTEHRINFPISFSEKPIKVITSIASTGSPHVQGCSSNGYDEYGFNIYKYRTNNGACTVNWIAIGR